MKWHSVGISHLQVGEDVKLWRMRPPLVLAALGCLVAGCGTTSVSAQAVNTGPLGGGGGRGVECVPGRLLTIGGDDVINTGHLAAVVTGVSLYRASGVRLVRAYLVPILSARGGTLIGMVGSFPPPASSIPSDAKWARRQRLPGAKVQPERPGVSYNLVVGLQRTTAAGKVGAVQFSYSEGGNSYVWRSSTSIEVLSGMECKKWLSRN
ncbi:MAG: hypothetical protein ACYDGN_10960 [Acidimicrobiales bacterium]